MATFKAMVYKARQRKDKTWNVVIRFTHGRKVRYIPTTMYVGKKDLTAAFNIKNTTIVERCEELIRIYRNRLNDLNLELTELDMETIFTYITRKDEGRGISFTQFALEWIEKKTKVIRTKYVYLVSLHALQRFFQSEEIYCNEITVKKMEEFEYSLSDKKRGQSMYTQCIKRMFNAARDYYNDEDNDVILIKNSLRKYIPPREKAARKRGLDAETIRRIFSLPYRNKSMRAKFRGSSYDLALDCFRLSFCLMGMNAADMFSAEHLEDNVLIYERQKTKNKRSDRAEIHVEVSPYITELMKVYKGNNGKVFNFSEHFNSLEIFNITLANGMKQISKELGLDRLQFYAARHSMATIAVNEVGISKYIVNDMLNHVDPGLKVTELYVQKDFRAINEANRKLLDYVFGGMKK